MSRRVLITGASGFAGAYLADACRVAGDDVVELTRASGTDLLDAGATAAAVAGATPEVVYHLAALAHVGRSWHEPEGTLRANQAMVLHVLDAVREHARGARVVCVSSGEVYGPPETLPVDEQAPLRPRNPYAVSKAAGELIAGFYADVHGLDIVSPRAFNHAGPRQPALYALASFARQVAAGLEAGDTPIRVVTGNPDARRDFTDVRDVARAYRLLAESDLVGPVNICSGRSVAARELVAGLAEVTGAAIEHVVDPALVRSHEVMEVRGSAARLTGATGWSPEIALERTLRDAVAWWREEIRAGRGGDAVHE